MQNHLSVGSLGTLFAAHVCNPTAKNAATIAKQSLVPAAKSVQVVVSGHVTTRPKANLKHICLSSLPDD